ncbi:unnamed protein product [Protopolystoma xenopodis]|uniref:Uncharacterized protein n=1 Tax=Protopolystoma xenopodis TaxID=117903 RepID=A0A448WUM0_9PLAT|nr:unnamed protein product [Protopolystoma xenopodis]
MAQLEKTTRWWSDCTVSWRERWARTRDERNYLRQQLRATQEELTSLLRARCLTSGRTRLIDDASDVASQRQRNFVYNTALTPGCPEFKGGGKVCYQRRTIDTFLPLAFSENDDSFIRPSSNPVDKGDPSLRRCGTPVGKEPFEEGAMAQTAHTASPTHGFSRLMQLGNGHSSHGQTDYADTQDFDILRASCRLGIAYPSHGELSFAMILIVI